jgi:hypothetical protein
VSLALEQGEYPTGESPLDAVLPIVMLGGHTEDYTGSSQGSIKGIMDVLLSQALVSLSSKDVWSKLAWSPNVRQILRMSPGNARGRSWCITENGYLGLVPGGTKTGDLIAIFSGGSLPFLVRSTSANVESDYTIVGHGYFHGLMNGEAYDLQTFKPRTLMIA